MNASQQRGIRVAQMFRVADLVRFPFLLQLFTEGVPCSAAALERTFLAWMHMAVTLGGVMTALVGFTYTDEDDPDSPYRRVLECHVVACMPGTRHPHAARLGGARRKHVAERSRPRIPSVMPQSSTPRPGHETS